MALKTQNTPFVSKTTLNINRVKRLNTARTQPFTPFINPATFNQFVEDMAQKMVADYVGERKDYKEAIESWLGGNNDFVIDVENEIETVDAAKRIRAALKQLTKQQREIITLIFYDGLTLPEIAVRLDMPGCKIDKIKSSALRKLRSILQTMEFGT